MSPLRCMWMRGGTSKGAFILGGDLPADPVARDAALLRVMGSPDPRQIDGMGGAHPLTSKVAVVTTSSHPDCDVDYLFLQVAVDEATVSDRQNCGNILAGVGPFAIERGLVAARDGITAVRVRMVNTGGRATARVRTPRGRVSYAGDVAISGVPGTAAPVVLDFDDTAGSSCGALLPTGNLNDEIAGVPVTCIDNGMPVVVIPAAGLGVLGYESAEELEANDALRTRLEEIRLSAGRLMGLGDVTTATVPKLTMTAPPRDASGTMCTRTFIPHRCHASIGVLGAVSVASAASLGSGAAPAATGPRYRLEHPSGHLDVEVETVNGQVQRSGVVRTARKLFDGDVFTD